MSEIRKCETNQPNHKIRVGYVYRHPRCLAGSWRIAARSATHRYCFINVQGDFIQRAKVKLQGRIVEVECIGVGSAVFQRRETMDETSQARTGS